ncbi:hypothetical protein F4802DRAFT_82221 [Xylaria palmicola]|nr:hypothetical protein F4802DRAFT_82221 [Xylaria palmicola]
MNQAWRLCRSAQSGDRRSNRSAQHRHDGVATLSDSPAFAGMKRELVRHHGHAHGGMILYYVSVIDSRVSRRLSAGGVAECRDRPISRLSRGTAIDPFIGSSCHSSISPGKSAKPIEPLIRHVGSDRSGLTLLTIHLYGMPYEMRLSRLSTSQGSSPARHRPEFQSVPAEASHAPWTASWNFQSYPRLHRDNKETRNVNEYQKDRQRQNDQGT